MITAMMNQKGGCGKSTSAQNLAAAYLRYYGFPVLMIDMDPQCNLTYAVGADHMLPTITDVLMNGYDIGSTIQHIEDAPDIIPASPMLATFDENLTAFRDVVAPLKEFYKLIVIDAPPSLGILTLSVLAVCDDVIVPVTANDVCSLQGLYNLADTVEAIRNAYNKTLNIAGILRTNYVPRRVLVRHLDPMYVDTATAIGTRVFDTVIRRCDALGEARATRVDIFKYRLRSNAAEDYKAFCDEYLDRRHG